MRADTHTHSIFSFDAQPHATVEAMCEAAIAEGLSYLAITDHCDICEENKHKVLERDDIAAALESAKQKYADRLTLLFGVELGQIGEFPDVARALLAKYKYDFVIGSLHNLPNERDFCYFDFSKTDEGEILTLMRRAIAENRHAVEVGGFHALGHLTYMHRYLLRDGRDFDFSLVSEEIAALFDLLIAKGIALEVNTSTLTTAGVTMPPRELLTLYRARGGRLITLASDAHAPERVAQNFEAAEQLLRECGFTEIAFPTANGIVSHPL